MLSVRSIGGFFDLRQGLLSSLERQIVGRCAGGVDAPSQHVEQTIDEAQLLLNLIVLGLTYILGVLEFVIGDGNQTIDEVVILHRVHFDHRCVLVERAHASGRGIAGGELATRRPVARSLPVHFLCCVMLYKRNR